MRGRSNGSRKPSLTYRLQCFRQRQEAWSAAHPFLSSVPFLVTAGVLLTSVVLATSCTLCYTVDIQGEKVSFFHEEATYRKAVSQAEERTSQILNTDYSFDQAATVHTTLASKNQIEALSQVTDSIMGAIPELEHVYTLWVDGTMVGAAQDSETITNALALVKEQYTTPETLSVQVENQIRLCYEYLPAEVGTCSTQELADLLLTQTPQTFSYTVQEGDTLENLLSLFSMTQDRLQELNPD